MKRMKNQNVITIKGWQYSQQQSSSCSFLNTEIVKDIIHDKKNVSGRDINISKWNSDINTAEVNNIGVKYPMRLINKYLIYYYLIVVIKCSRRDLNTQSSD